MPNVCFYGIIINNNNWKVKGDFTMCDICLQSPHHPNCPNAAEAPAVFICSECGDDIYEGEWVWHILGEQYCEKCINDIRGVAEYDPY